MPATASAPQKKGGQKEKIPEYLIKEILDGVPVYYKGYRDVLNKTKTYEEIMADGLLQAVLKNWLQFLLNWQLNSKKYWILAGEVGSHLSKKNNLAHNLTIFETSVLTPDKVKNKYADFPAKLILEIDSEVEYGEGKSNEEYIHRKTQRVFDFGTEKVIWIFTSTRKIMVATPCEDWRIFGWDRDVEVLDGVTFNIPRFLKEKNIELTEEND